MAYKRRDEKVGNHAGSKKWTPGRKGSITKGAAGSPGKGIGEKGRVLSGN